MLRLCTFLLILLVPLVPRAELSSTWTLTSDYVFRGVTQTAEDPALQGSIDFEGESGGYVGLWGSNVDFDDCCDEDIELNWYAGYAPEFGEDFALDLGIIYYNYPGASDNLDYGEVYFGGSWRWISATWYYTDNFFGIGEAAWYLDAQAEFDLPWSLWLGLHAGYTDGDALDEEFAEDTGLEDYADWSVTLGRSFGPFDIEVAYHDTDLSGEFKDTGGANANDDRVVFSVTTSFPW
jgi:uncharacterized protein (TIGR02001 family)